MKSQSGFTLIEMVAVIIILAIMAANAMPRFSNMTGEARLSTLNGMVSALNSAKVLAKSKWVAANSANLVTIDMGGTFVSVASGVGFNGNTAFQGFPYAGNTSGMWGALDRPTGFNSAVTVASGLILWPTGTTNSAVCNVQYSAGTVTVSAAQPANCL